MVCIENKTLCANELFQFRAGPAFLYFSDFELSFAL